MALSLVLNWYYYTTIQDGGPYFQIMPRMTEIGISGGLGTGGKYLLTITWSINMDPILINFTDISFIKSK